MLMCGPVICQSLRNSGCAIKQLCLDTEGEGFTIVLQDGGNSEGLSFLTSKYVPNPQHREHLLQLSSMHIVLMLPC